MWSRAILTGCNMEAGRDFKHQYENFVFKKILSVCILKANFHKLLVKFLIYFKSSTVFQVNLIVILVFEVSPRLHVAPCKGYTTPHFV